LDAPAIAVLICSYAINGMDRVLFRGEAIRILVRNLPPMPRTVAEASYAELLSPADGFFRDCDISLQGMNCILDLRSRYGSGARPLANPMKYCDLRYYRSAIR
jgi:hypothetical protein